MDKSKNDWEINIEANVFAVELLMPEEFIRRDMAQHKGEPVEDVISLMAKRYEVDKTLMTARLATLGYFPF